MLKALGIRRRQHGWILVEVMAAAALLSIVLAIFHEQYAHINLRVSTVREAYRTQQQQRFQQQVKAIFDMDLDAPENPVSVPQCQICRGSALRQVLQYELTP